ncbi:unnamed protein product [Prorocentrum cordatum]|uniref:AB hydrolase-1 domain-containing protein n=1 Tax=Prorocentrum cordatum TaxID=2364126 RepID=A0ABN9Q8P8_9DINO|nr:unnamed protein product [Polarella glacialis]
MNGWLRVVLLVQAVVITAGRGRYVLRSPLPSPKDVPLAKGPSLSPPPRGGRAPIVFCHGLGIGVLAYVDFVLELGSSGSEMFLLDMKHISLRQNVDIPSSRETVACVVDMLAAWGHSEAHFVGHSFGTVVVSWILRNSRVALSVSLLDPICFLLFKHDIVTNALGARGPPPGRAHVPGLPGAGRGLHPPAELLLAAVRPAPRGRPLPRARSPIGQGRDRTRDHNKGRLSAERRRRRELLRAEALAHKALGRERGPGR